MRRVNLDKIQPGTILKKTIITLEGKVLLASGMELTEEYIRKLQANGISEVYIEDEISKDISIPEVVREDIVIEAKSMVKVMMSKPSIKNSIDGKQIMEIVDRIISNILANGDIIASLSDIRSVDDYTFSHSVNVCIYSLIIGIGMGLTGEKLRELGVGAILHDIGKVMVPQEILNKPLHLSSDEFEEVKRHTYYGYEILRNTNGISMMASYIALGHHERMDGSGYPYQLKGNNIHKYARIVAVSDVYVALTSERIYRKKLMPYEVINYITSLSNHHFDKNVVDVFIRYVAYYPVGTAVILNTGEKGIVSRYNKYFPTRPTVRVVMDETGKKLPKYKEVDLTEKQQYSIVDIWDI
ncbi:MAG: HD-GYP domain-containing protein [Clostridiaceae bacterium]|nr:HD-GYP domain-containing protein [Clostridiaceae bacterium]